MPRSGDPIRTFVINMFHEPLKLAALQAAIEQSPFKDMEIEETYTRSRAEIRLRVKQIKNYPPRYFRIKIVEER